MPDRSDTPVTFSREEIAEIREMLITRDNPPICPRCQGELTVEEPDVEALKEHVYLKCGSCHRTAFVSRTPPHRQFDL
jgi:ribosomal protein S27AE